MVLKLSKQVHFLQFCADLSQKPQSGKATYLYDLKVAVTVFHKMMWFIGV